MRNTICRGVGVAVLAWVAMATAVRANDDSPLRVDRRGCGDYTTIQAAIDAARAGDEIAVAPGTYCESIDLLGKAIRLYSLAGADCTTIDGAGREHVVRCMNGEEPDTILEGFTITGGNACDSSGGGLLTNGRPTVIRCTFNHNSARFGGAIAGRAGIAHCLFTDNDAFMGGALWRAGTATDCTFTRNGADMGGAINDVEELARCTFIDNIDCVFEAGLVTDCTFRENQGGAALGNAEIVTNCTFIGNQDAGIVTRIDLYSTVTQCTFLNNGVGVRSGQGGVTTMANCIIWGSIDAAIQGPAIVTFSDIEGGWEGEGNIDVDPLFADGEGRLFPGSLCLDAGTNDPPDGLTPLDILGNPRPADGNGDGIAVADMCAYETPNPVQLLDVLIDVVTDLGLPQRSNDCLLGKLQAARKALENRSEANDLAASAQLTSFISAVQACRCTMIPPSDADALVAAAQQIIDLLEAE
ncbi:MAG: right-handed parallel beta-helix repeat-containing protein [Phycisphaerales bacterium]